MFLAMNAIFSRGFLFGLLMLLAACGEREPAVVIPPKDAAAVAEPFLKELRAGNRAKAESYVSSAAMDELAAQFAGDHKKLAASSALTPRFFNSNAAAQGGTAEGEEINMVYAARKDGKWTTATVRVYRYRDEPFKIEYWRVTNKAPTMPLNSNINEEKLKESQTLMFGMFGGIALFGLLGLLVLFWVIKRQPQLISPDIPVETRKSAATVGDE